MKHPANSKNFFDSGAKSYAENFSDKHTAISLEFSERCSIVKNLTSSLSGSLLDCACGSGVVTLTAIESGHFALCHFNDISPEMIALTSSVAQTHPKLTCKTEFTCESIFDLLHNDPTKYDCIICIGLIAHTGNLSALLTLIANRLSPGGHLLLQNSLKYHPFNLINRIFLSQRFKMRSGYFLSYFSSRDLEQQLQRNYLSIVSDTRFCLSIPFFETIMPKINYYIYILLKPLASFFGSQQILLVKNTDADG